MCLNTGCVEDSAGSLEVTVLYFVSFGNKPYIRQQGTFFKRRMVQKHHQKLCHQKSSKNEPFWDCETPISTCFDNV